MTRSFVYNTEVHIEIVPLSNAHSKYANTLKYTGLFRWLFSQPVNARRELISAVKQLKANSEGTPFS